MFFLKEDEVNASPLQARADGEPWTSSNYQDLGFFHRSGSKAPRPQSFEDLRHFHIGLDARLRGLPVSQPVTHRLSHLACHPGAGEWHSG
jgi:hypothetical protein